MSGIAGIWSAEMKTPFGNQTFTITLKDGEPPLGIMENAEGRAEVENLVLTEDTANFTLPIEKPIKAVVVWKLRAEGDAISGTVKAGFFPASKLVGTRAVDGVSA
jgi:hypothetical protein